MIDPEFWSDEDIGSWTHTARLFYIALWNFADDKGRFKAHPNLLKSQIFPYDEKIDIEILKKELGNKVQWYQINGSIYGFLRNFDKHQRIDRPQESKLPPPPEENIENTIQKTQFDEHSTNIRGMFVPNIREVKLREVNITPCPLRDTEQEQFIQFKNEIQTVWNDFALRKKRPLIKFISGEREKNLMRRFKDKNFMDNWKEALKKCENIPFYFGDNPSKWKINFDYFLRKNEKKEDNWINMLEEKYKGFGGKL